MGFVPARFPICCRTLVWKKYATCRCVQSKCIANCNAHNESQEGIIARLQRNQAEDEELSDIWDRAINNQAKGYVIKNGLLHKELNGDTLIVVPKLMQNTIIRQAHERGHFGPDKTEKLLKMNYWFKGMRSKVEKIIRNCISCILAERKHDKQEGCLHPIPKSESPLDTYHVDHLGPLPSTKKKYRHFILIFKNSNVVCIVFAACL